MEFKVVSEFNPAGDQPAAIKKLVEGIKKNYRYQTLLGVTGSGKTFSMAKVIEDTQKTTLVIAPNKTLAAQLASELRGFFPNNAVEYFVSYYDYYQPEAYVPSKDLYIEKDSSINDEIDKLRHSTTSSLLQRRDVIVVASVSCIYNLGSPEEYLSQMLKLDIGQQVDRDDLLLKLIKTNYMRNDYQLERGKIRARGDSIEIWPSYEEKILKVELFGDEIEKLSMIDYITGEVTAELKTAFVYPATHFLLPENQINRALKSIKEELAMQVAKLEKENKLLEAQRLKMRTLYDLEMIEEMGYCSGIENYSRHLTGKPTNSSPDTLMEYFPNDYMIIIDESHIAIPQINAMYHGDRSRKETLVKYGFRLPSALDNRPLKFDEFEKRVNQAVFVSATPGKWELENSKQVVDQIIRPTGLIDPEIIVRPVENQIDDLLREIKKREEKNERVLVTTLTKKMAEDLTDYFLEMGVKARYMHSDIATIERIEILRELRSGSFDCLVGINLLREGLDLPEVSLVAILDADKEGFLRSEGSLIQTIGRTARNVSGQVIMYADKMTGGMKRAISETERRRNIQRQYNKKNNITPQTIRKEISDILELTRESQTKRSNAKTKKKYLEDFKKTPKQERVRIIQALEEEMRQAAEEQRYEDAATIRDELLELKHALSDIHLSNK